MENKACTTNNPTDARSATATTRVNVMAQHGSTTNRRDRGATPRPPRRRAALWRLRRMKLWKAMRTSRVAATNTTLAQLAGETIQMLEQRIRYWAHAGDREHVRRLQAVQQQLIATYDKHSD